MDDPLAPARALFPGRRLAHAELIREGDRADVWRAWLDGDARQPVVVKCYTTAGEGWVRETAALSVIGGRPALLAESGEPPLLVLTDLGSGRSVADALLGDDPAVATEAVARWAEAIGRLHRDTVDGRAAFRAALDGRAGQLPVDEHVFGPAVHDLARAVDDRCAALGIPTSSAALDELRGLAHRLGPDGPAALTPADACPDNNVDVGDQVVLIDYEGAQWRHVAWDLAYLRVPWPTCWCSWRIPDPVADLAIERYRKLAGGALPYVTTDAFAADVAAACTGWAFLSFDLFATAALDGDPPNVAHRPTPSRRAMILHRLAGAAAEPQLPALADLAGRLRAGLVERWGEPPLAYAPAFRAVASG